MDVGEIVRRVHWRAWDADVPAPEVSIAEVVAALPVLIESGSAGVVWPRLRDSVVRAAGADHPAGMALEAAAASQAAHNARAERELARVVGRLREVGIEPVLIKGLAVARLYPAGLVRPAGDLDLVVRDEDYAAAIEALAGWRLSFHGDAATKRTHARAGAEADSPMDVDLHSASRWYGSRGCAGFFAAGAMVTIAGTDVRVPRAEDHLRALCLHFLRHGAVRPVRLCDIALMVEGDNALRPYDWERVLRGSRSQVEQIGVAIRLAEALLGAAAGARVADAPVRPLPDALPGWVAPAVLRQWAENPRRTMPHVRELLAGPGAAWTALASRWPDPLSATVRVGARFDDGARWPIQVAAFGKHGALFGAKLALDQVKHLIRRS